jgi:SulP family sulfate permease
MKDFKPKLLTILQEGITWSLMKREISSGIVVGIVALPLAIAFAIASGVSPDKGLVTAVVAGFLISLLGGSRVQIGGPTGAFIVIVCDIIARYGLQGLLISTMMAGVILIFLGFFRLGNYIKFIPQPMIIGFTAGIAVIIFSTQINDFLGLALTDLPGGFLDKLNIYFSNLDKTNYYALAIALFTLIISFTLPRISKKVPATLAAIILSTLVVNLFELPVETISSRFGEIPSSFPAPALPEFTLSSLTQYIHPAIAIALLGAIESLLSAVVADGMIRGRHRSNTELIAQGVANILSPIFGGIPATGAIARTSTNVSSGGRTPIAGMVHAGKIRRNDPSGQSGRSTHPGSL